jgi:hypothetical protein
MENRKHPPTTSHNYLPKVVAFIVASKGVCRLQDTAIHHDDWCDMFSGGYCNCDPWVTYMGAHDEVYGWPES